MYTRITIVSSIYRRTKFHCSGAFWAWPTVLTSGRRESQGEGESHIVDFSGIDGVVTRPMQYIYWLRAASWIVLVFAEKTPQHSSQQIQHASVAFTISLYFIESHSAVAGSEVRHSIYLAGGGVYPQSLWLPGKHWGLDLRGSVQVWMTFPCEESQLDFRGV